MRYHVTYTVQTHPEGIEKGAVPGDTGACTAILIGSLLYPEDGSYSAAFAGLDGRTAKPLEDAEIWKAWVMLAKRLGDSKSLSEHKRELAQLVWQAVCAAMQAIEDENHTGR